MKRQILIFPILRDHVILTCRICSRLLSFDKKSLLGKIASDLDMMNTTIICEECRDDISGENGVEIIDLTREAIC